MSCGNRLLPWLPPPQGVHKQPSDRHTEEDRDGRGRRSEAAESEGILIGCFQAADGAEVATSPDEKGLTACTFKAIKVRFVNETGYF